MDFPISYMETKNYLHKYPQCTSTFVCWEHVHVCPKQMLCKTRSVQNIEQIWVIKSMIYSECWCGHLYQLIAAAADPANVCWAINLTSTLHSAQVQLLAIQGVSQVNFSNRVAYFFITLMSCNVLANITTLLHSKTADLVGDKVYSTHLRTIECLKEAIQNALE